MRISSQLFSKFVRLTEAINSMQRGAGLGLYLCRQLTEAMGGYIWLESTGVAGEGCTFFIAFPFTTKRRGRFIVPTMSTVI